MTVIFLSVGRCHTPEQERFVGLVEDYLRSAGLSPRTPGRNRFDAGDPLFAIRRQMQASRGAVIVALERIRVERGAERGRAVTDFALVSPWVQIEAAMAYMTGLPTLVLRANGVKAEGMLEGHGAFCVDDVAIDAPPHAQPGFAATFEAWRRTVLQQDRAS